jgi:hypothetical protein
MKRSIRTLLIVAALASFIVFLWMETSLGRSPIRGWLFFLAYTLAALLLDQGGGALSLGKVLKYLGLDRLRPADLLRALLCWGGGVMWVYVSALVTGDDIAGAVITFGPFLVLLAIGVFFAIRGIACWH